MMNWNIVGVVISAICAGGSFVSFVLARIEKRKAKISEEKTQHYAETAEKYYRNQMLSQLQDKLVREFTKHEHTVFKFTVKDIAVQFAGYDIADVETVLECLKNQGQLVCKDEAAMPKEYFINSSGYKMNSRLEDGTFHF